MVVEALIADAVINIKSLVLACEYTAASASRNGHIQILIIKSLHSSVFVGAYNKICLVIVRTIFAGSPSHEEEFRCIVSVDICKCHRLRIRLRHIRVRFLPVISNDITLIFLKDTEISSVGC